MAGNPKRDRNVALGLGVGIVVGLGILAYQNDLIDPSLVAMVTGGAPAPSPDGEEAADEGAVAEGGAEKAEGPAEAKGDAKDAKGAPAAKGSKSTSSKSGGEGTQLSALGAGEGEDEGEGAGEGGVRAAGGEAQGGDEGASQGATSSEGADPADALLLPSTETKGAPEELVVPQALSEIEGWRAEGKAPDATRLRRFLTHKKAWVAVTAFAWAVEAKALPDAELARVGRGLKERHPGPLLKRALKRFASKPEVVAAMRAHLGL